MAELFLKPARAGDIIRDPASGRPMPPEGEAKPRTTHWLRRLARGEVVETNANAIAEGKAAREAEEAKPAAAEPAADSEQAEATSKTRKAKE